MKGGPKLSLWVFGHNEKFMIYCSVVQEQNMGSGASKNPASGITEDMIDQKKYMVVKNSTGEVRLKKEKLLLAVFFRDAKNCARNVH